MADYQSKVELVIGGNSAEAVEALKKAQTTAEEVSKKVPKQFSDSGKKAGDQFGKQLYTSQRRWLSASQQLLRTYGGRVGRIIANILQSFGQLRAAQMASGAVGGAGGGAAGRGTGMGTAAGTAAGAAAGGLAGTSRRKRKPPKLNKMPTIEREDVDLFFPKPGMLSPTEHEQVYQKLIEVRERYNKNLEKGALKKVAGKALLRGMGIAFKAFGITVVGTLAGIGALFAIAAKRTESFRKEIEQFKSKMIVDELNQIADPVERTVEILRRFGENGTEQFREMEKATEELNKTLADPWGLRRMGEVSRVTVEAMKDDLDPSWFVRNAQKIVKTVTSWWGDISEEMANEMARGVAAIEVMQAKVDDNNKKKAQAILTLEEEEAKQIKDNKEKELELDKDIREAKISFIEAQMTDEERLLAIRRTMAMLEKTALKNKEHELALIQLQTEEYALQEQINSRRALATDEDKAKEFFKLAKNIREGKDADGNTLSPLQRHRDAQQEGLSQRKSVYELDRHFREMDSQRAQKGISRLTPEERLTLATEMQLNKLADKAEQEPMDYLAAQFKEHGALPVIPAFSK